MGIDHNKRLKEHLYYYSARISRDISNLIKWLVFAVITGCIVGAASTLFSFTLKAVTSYRKAHEWIFLLLPLSGLVIVFLYEKLGKEDGGTNQVLSTVRSRDDVPILSAPLIFITTALTHLAGGSAGREGAAIQLGGSIANQLGRWIHLDEEDRHVIVMCGMSAAFSALFGTPMAAAVFALEVVSVGVDDVVVVGFSNGTSKALTWKVFHALIDEYNRAGNARQLVSPVNIGQGHAGTFALNSHAGSVPKAGVVGHHVIEGGLSRSAVSANDGDVAAYDKLEGGTAPARDLDLVAALHRDP